MRGAGWSVIFLIGLCAVGLLPSLGRVVAEQEKELRVLLTARGMVEEGNWLVPEYRGEVRLKKPPLMYWIVAGVFRLAGTTESLLAGRAPTALMGVGLVLAIYGCGSSWIGRRRALVAAGIGASAWCFLQYGRIGSSDVPLSLFVLLALHSGYRAVTQPGRSRHWLALGLFAGIGFMIKGVAALGIPLAAIVVFALARRRFRRGLVTVRALWAPAVFALLALPWYGLILFYAQTRGIADSVIQHEMVQTFGGRGHPGSILYYFYELPAVMMPWGLLLPFAIVRCWRPARRHAGLGFLLASFAVTFLLLSLTTAKQVHYTVLMLPTSALILGYLVAPRRAARPAWHRRLSRGYVAGVLLLLALAGVALVATCFVPPKGVEWPRGHAAWVGIVMSVAALAGLVVPVLRVYRRQVWLVCLLVALAGAWYHAFLFDRVKRESLARELALQARGRIAKEARVYGVGAHLAVVEFYLHRPIQDEPDLSAAWSQARPGDAVVQTVSATKAGGKEELPGSPALVVENARWSCRLFEKPTEPGLP